MPWSDPNRQTLYRLFKKVESEKSAFFVPVLVVLELIWVLESAYEISREEIIESISEMLLMPILQFEHQSALQEFTHFAQKNRYDLSDLIIAYSAKEQGCESVITFDKKASKSGLFELME